ncbi:hypothetical protein AAE478_007730 [Parahypoxylon ruwenzoriense]
METGSEAQAWIRGGKPVHERDPNVEGSDEDEDGIPKTSQPKSPVSPGLRPPHHHRTRSRQINSGTIYINRIMKHKAKGAHMFLTPSSPPVTPPARATASWHGDTGELSPEDAVPAGLINDALAQKQHVRFASHSENCPQDREDVRVGTNYQNTEEQICQYECANARDENPPASVSDRERESQTGDPLEKSNVPQRASDLEPSLQIGWTRTNGECQSASQSSNADLENADRDAHHDNKLRSKRIDGFDTDDDSEGDADLSTKESFPQDVADFKARYPSGYVGVVTFEVPPENNDIAIPLEPVILKSALRLMCHRSWAGIKGHRHGWFREPFYFEPPSTEPVRALLLILVKLEKLSIQAPKAPQIRHQNEFLSKHSGLLSYYFSEVKLVVDYIRRQRLAKGTPGQSEQNDTEERKKISMEILQIIIPMLFRILAHVWCLGGNEWKRTKFTISTIEFIRRILGRIRLLYRSSFRELVQHPPPDEELQLKSQKDKYREGIKKLEELGPLLEDFRDTMKAGLAEFKRAEEIKAQWERDSEARRRLAEEQHYRSLLSARGIHIPRSESAIAYFAQASSASRVPRSQSTKTWSLEEKTLLFTMIQNSYPDLPCLTQVCRDLDRTLGDVEAMASELLGLMFEAVLPEETAAERVARVEGLMRAYRRANGRREDGSAGQIAS